MEQQLLELFDIFPINTTNEECSICNEINDEIMVSLTCKSGKHPDYVHMKCIWNWYSKEGNNCPFCRNDYKYQAIICRGIKEIISGHPKQYKNIITLVEIIGISKNDNNKVISILEKITHPLIDDVFILTKCIYLNKSSEILFDIKFIELLIDKLKTFRRNKDFSECYAKYLKEICMKDECNMCIPYIENIVDLFDLESEKGIYSLIAIIRKILVIKPELTDEIYKTFEKILDRTENIFENSTLYAILKFFKDDDRVKVKKYTLNLMRRIIPLMNEKTHLKIIKFIELSFRDNIWNDEFDIHLYNYIIKFLDTNTELDYFQYIRVCYLAEKYEEYRKVFKEKITIKYTNIEWNIDFLLNQKSSVINFFAIYINIYDDENRKKYAYDINYLNKLIQNMQNDHNVEYIKPIIRDCCIDKKSALNILNYLYTLFDKNSNFYFIFLFDIITEKISKYFSLEDTKLVDKLIPYMDKSNEYLKYSILIMIDWFKVKKTREYLISSGFFRKIIEVRNIDSDFKYSLKTFKKYFCENISRNLKNQYNNYIIEYCPKENIDIFLIYKPSNYSKNQTMTTHLIPLKLYDFLTVA